MGTTQRLGTTLGQTNVVVLFTFLKELDQNDQVHDGHLTAESSRLE